MSEIEPIRVLLVEDDDAYALFIGEQLKVSGWPMTLRRVSTLTAALQALAAEPFDAILLDPGLPDSEGLETIARAQAAASRIAIVVLTSHDDDQLAVAAVQSGAQDYLLKSSTDAQTLGRALRHARERVSFRAALHESEARKSAIIDAALDGVVVIDRTGTITEFNHAAEHLFGHTRNQALGQEVGRLLIPPGYREQHWAALRSYDESAPVGILRRRMQVEGLHADGSLIPLELALVALPCSQGPLFVAFMRDLSEQRKAEHTLRVTEDELRQAHKMEAVGRLAGGVAHDFNNVLTAIFGYTELLLDQLPDGNPLRADVEEIRHSAERAAGLTRQLLAFSRKQVMQSRVVNLNEVVRGVQKLLARLVTDDVQLCLNLSPDLWLVRADPGQIEQVLMNLTTNARDAMPEGGRLALDTANVVVSDVDPIRHPGLKLGEYAAMTVGDTGEGMPTSVRSHIFEPFFTTKELGKGTGLGLATVYGIVKQSGGGVYVESEEGHGTRFVIYLPRVPDQQGSVRPPNLPA